MLQASLSWVYNHDPAKSISNIWPKSYRSLKEVQEMPLSMFESSNIALNRFLLKDRTIIETGNTSIYIRRDLLQWVSMGSSVM